MSTTKLEKSLSLVERKQLQWAREREELAELTGPWSNPDSANKAKHQQKLSQNAHSYLRNDGIGSARRSSLPPINKSQNYAYVANDKDMGGETSGYGSDNPNHTPEYHQQSYHNGYESSSSARDDRAKWGDRGKQMWHDISDYSNVINAPGWVRRGLHGETEVIVSNTSPSESPEQEYGDRDRPLTCSTTTSNKCNYIRGQNAPLDPLEVAERDRRRQLAMVHQDAIRQQVEDRERRRREEKERRIQEEREEELRIERDQEIERKRKDEEQKIMMEKRERELKRKQAIQEALEMAEKAAREAKMVQKKSRQGNLNINENVEDKDKLNSEVNDEAAGKFEETQCANTPKERNDEKANNANCDTSSIDNQARLNNTITDKNCNQLERKEPNINRNVLVTPSHSLPSPTVMSQSEIITASQPPSLDMYSTMPQIPSMPFAILMPAFQMVPQHVPVPIPISTSTETSPIARTENRVLTPTQYRNNKRYSDSSTQTDTFLAPKTDIDQTREKLTGTEMAMYDGRRKERSRVMEKVKEMQEGRPKWGVNRPPTRYIKQSEKDPFYQRRKSRAKDRAIIKLYDEKNNYSPHSSDDSPTASPRLYRKRGYVDKRRTRALWQKNVQLYQTEIMPLESDKEQIYYKKNDCIRCCCDCRSENHRYVDLVKMVDVLKIDSPKNMEYKGDVDDTSLPNCNNPNIDSDTLERLSELHSGVINNHWERASQTPIPDNNDASFHD